jgi:23S rRNA pseudouridine1911/1915/1917 synthase
VRAHAAHLNHPLVGDSLYGATTTLDGFTTKPRQFFLHAWQVEFIHPTTGMEVVARSDYECELMV